MSWSETLSRRGVCRRSLSRPVAEPEGFKDSLIKERGKGPNKTSGGTKEEGTSLGSARNTGTGVVPDSASKESGGK